MKRMILLTALAVAACGQSKAPPAEAAAPAAPGPAVIATFSGTVDTVAGTMSLDASSRPSSLAADLVIPEWGGAQAKNAGSPWFNEQYHCTNDPQTDRSWGGQVYLESQYGSNYLTGAYAEITTWNGPAGSESCNGFQSSEIWWDPGLLSPEGTDSTKGGLFPYPTAIAAGGVSGNVEWAFKWVSAGSWSFWGRILGGLLNLYTPNPAPEANTPAIAALGSGIVYATSTGFSFMNASGVVTGSSRTTTNTPKILRPNAAGTRIWYVTQAGGAPNFWYYIGYTAADGTGGLSLQVSGSANSVNDIVQDPGTSDWAWISTNAGTLVKVTGADAGPLVWGTSRNLTGGSNGRGIAFDGSGNVFVASYGSWSDGRIDMFSRNVATTAPLDTINTTVTNDKCSAPQGLTRRASDGTFWFVGVDSTTLGFNRPRLCQLSGTVGEGWTLTARATGVNASSGASALCFSPSDVPWFFAHDPGDLANGKRVHKADAAGTHAAWPFATVNQPYQIACASDGTIWVGERKVAGATVSKITF